MLCNFRMYLCYWALVQLLLFRPSIQKKIYVWWATSGGTRLSLTTKMTELVGSPEELLLADIPTRRCVLQKMLLDKMVFCLFESREGDGY